MATVSFGVGCDVTAVDGDGGCEDASVIIACGIDAEGAVAAAVGLAGDGEGRGVAALDAAAVDSLPARSDVHVAVVGEDEGDVAGEGDAVGVVEGAGGEVVAGGEAVVAGVEEDGVGGGGGAVGCGVCGGGGGAQGLAVNVGGGVVEGAVEVVAAVVELLAVGYLDGAAVAAGGDAVGGLGPAEGDGAAGADACAVFAAGGVDGAAVDGDAAAGPDAVASAVSRDGAAVDGDATCGALESVSVAVGYDGAAVDGDGFTYANGSTIVALDIDVAAVDGEAVVGIDTLAVVAVVSDGDVAAVHVDAAEDGDAAVVGAGVAGAVYIKVACAEGLSVDGQGIGAAGWAGEALSANPALVRPHVHRASVFEYEGDVAVEGEGVVELDGGEADEVGAGGEARLGAVEGDGLVGLGGGAVGCDVAEGDGLVGGVWLAGVDADGGVGVGHLEGPAAGGASG